MTLRSMLLAHAVPLRAAERAPTCKSALVSPVLKPVRTSCSASVSSSSKTAEAFLVGSASRTRAAAPETCGQAIDVPLKLRLPVSEVCDALTTLLPGAQIFVQDP